MPTTTSPRSERPLEVLRRVDRVAVRVLAGLILVQAFLAGRYLFGSWSITVHGVIGNTIFAIGMLAAGTMTAGRAPLPRIAVGWGLVALLTAQVGLGYAGRTSLDAAAWHVPVGVAAFGLAVYLSTTAAPVPGPRSTK